MGVYSVNTALSFLGWTRLHNCNYSNIKRKKTQVKPHWVTDTVNIFKVYLQIHTNCYCFVKKIKLCKNV